MEIISQHFAADVQAERYQQYLYGLHDHVRLVMAPMFGGAGTYHWEVAERTPSEEGTNHGN